jgi:hypothetical protein
LLRGTKVYEFLGFYPDYMRQGPSWKERESVYHLNPSALGGKKGSQKPGSE